MRVSNLRAVLSMIAGVGCFALMDACMKQLAITYQPMQVSFMRNLASLPLVLGMALLTGGGRALKPVHWALHFFRGIIGVGMLWTFIYSLTVLSLADAYSVFLSAPLLITALSAVMLKEYVGWHRWVAITIGLIGVLMILRPSGASVVTLGGVAALAAATCYAVSVNTIRFVARKDSVHATIFWQLLITASLSGLLCLSRWTAIRLADWPWIMVLGVTGAFGQYFLTQAFRRAPAASVAPFEYTSLLWGMLLDWFLWRTLPSPHMFLGASIVVASGLYVIYREARSTDARRKRVSIERQVPH